MEQMDNAEKSSLVRIIQVLVPIVGVGVAIVGLLIGLAGRKKDLVCSYLGSDKLVSLDAGGVSDAVKVDYQNQTVTSLMKMRFVIRNTGSSAIKGEDVREPITFVFPKSVRILNSAVDRTSPMAFNFQVISNPSDNTVSCNFPLLNSGDEAYFSVFTYNSTPVVPEIRGRIVDVKEIEHLDESQRQQANPIPFVTSIGVRKVFYWVAFVFNTLCASLTLGFALYAIGLFVRLRLWWSKWKKAFDKNREFVFKSQGNKPSAVLDYLAEEELKKQGVPKKPDSLYDDWTDLFSGTLVLLVVCSIFFISAVFMYHSPRGY